MQYSTFMHCDVTVQFRRSPFTCQASKRQQYLSIVLQPAVCCLVGRAALVVAAKHHFLPTVYRLCLEFFSSGWMQNHFVFVFCGAFSLSLKLQNWMLSLCSLLSLVSEGRCRPKWEIEGLPIGTSWWWNVKNAEYLIPTFVMCPKPDISMSTKMLFWYRPSRVSGPVQRRGVSEQTGR